MNPRVDMSSLPPGESARATGAGAAKRAPAPLLSEAQLHHAVSQFLDIALPKDAIWHHSPNEGKRGWRSQRSLKRNGTRAGWPDIEIIWRGRAYFIELKSEKGRLTAAQGSLHTRVWDAGCPVAICRSLDTVRDNLRAWGMIANEWVIA